MSVNFNSGIIYGWKLTQGQYEGLSDDCRDTYGIQTNCYSCGGDYFVGVIQYTADEGSSCIIPTDGNYSIPFEDLMDIVFEIPDVIAVQPNPTLYMYCQIS